MISSDSCVTLDWMMFVLSEYHEANGLHDICDFCMACRLLDWVMFVFSACPAIFWTEWCLCFQHAQQACELSDACVFSMPSRLLNWVMFIFSACPEGSWGAGCSQACSCVVSQGLCDPVNGSCSCYAGWMGTDCDTGELLPPQSALMTLGVCCTISHHSVALSIICHHFYHTKCFISSSSV